MPHRPLSSDSSTTPSRSRISSDFPDYTGRYQSLFPSEASQQYFTSTTGEDLFGVGSAASQNANDFTRSGDYDIALQALQFHEQSPSSTNHAYVSQQLSESPWSPETRRSRPSEANTTKGPGVVSLATSSSTTGSDLTSLSGNRPVYPNSPQGRGGDLQYMLSNAPVNNPENVAPFQPDNTGACACLGAANAVIAIRWEAVLEYERKVSQREQDLIQRELTVYQHEQFVLSMYNSLPEQSYSTSYSSSSPPSAPATGPNPSSPTTGRTLTAQAGPMTTTLASGQSHMSPQQYHSPSFDQVHSVSHALSQQLNQLASVRRDNTPAVHQMRPERLPLPRMSSAPMNAATRPTSSFPSSCWVPGCNKTFTREDGVKRHWDDQHSGKKYKCKICGALNGRKDKLRKYCRHKHRRTEGDDWYEWIAM